MRGLLFGVRPEDQGPVPPDVSPQLRALATVPMRLTDIADPVLPADDWVLLRTRLCGICGSDSKQVFMDGDSDSAMTALISFPQVMGHELVGEIVEAGSASGRRVGERIVLNPWLSCATRGLALCPACSAGDVNLCHHFTDGHLPPGIHTGNSSAATGGFGELVPAHTSMAIPCPDDLSDEVAVLADPFAVSLHAVLRNPPPPGARVLVYGAGMLGLTTCAVLELLHPDVSVAVVARFPHQGELARRHGASPFDSDPAQLVEALAEWTGAVVRRPWEGLSWFHPGGVDLVYDTVATPETIEVGVRVLAARGRLVLTGVSAPGRFEWSPWYFKELTLIGSNAFGMETVEGVRQHAIAHYLDLARSGRVDVSHLLTHTFRLEEWRAAFETIARQGETGCLKVAFDHR